MFYRLKLNINTFKQYAAFIKTASVFLMFLFFIVLAVRGGTVYAQDVKPPKVVQNIKIPKNGDITIQRENQARRSPEYILRHDRVREAMKMGRIVPLSQIRSVILKKFSGKIIQMRLFELSNKNRPYIYNVRLITDEGELISVTLDATSAKILSVKGKR